MTDLVISVFILANDNLKYEGKNWVRCAHLLATLRTDKMLEDGLYPSQINLLIQRLSTLLLSQKG